MSKATKKHLHLKVVFDTNAIWNTSSSDLIKLDIARIIEKHSNPADIKISWIIPDIVIQERKFQMRKRGKELLPSIVKLEKLLGHNLAIDEDIIFRRIDDAIAGSVRRYGIDVKELDTTKVNWQSIISSAANRISPFEDSEKEKGFRDSIVLETAVQIVDESPTSISICRIILVTNDKLLSEAFLNRVKEKKNATVQGTMDDVESLINILDSQIQEDLVKSISQEVASIFFTDSTNKDSLYYKEHIIGAIQEKFKSEMGKVPTNATSVRQEQITISKPGFVKKDKQRVFWKTIVTIERKAIKLKSVFESLSFDPAIIPVVKPVSDIYTGYFPAQIDRNDIVDIPISSIKWNTRWNDLIRDNVRGTETAEEVIATGQSKFEIIWSVLLTTNKLIKNPKVEDIRYQETTWS